jgi:protein SCO1/2
LLLYEPEDSHIPLEDWLKIESTDSSIKVPGRESDHPFSQVLAGAKIGFSLLVLWFLVVFSLWGFAFLPAPGLSSEWCLRIQAICFDTTANGLPSSQGWMLLVLGPLSLSLFMWASHARELAAVPVYLRSSRLAFILALALLVTLIIEGHIVSRRIVAGMQMSQIIFKSPEKNPLPTEYPRTEKPVPAFSLIDQNGKTFSEKSFRGQVTILTFAYAHCATVCPVLVHNVLEAQKRLQATGGSSAEVNAVFITLDPWRDTPNTLLERTKTWKMTSRSYLLSGKISSVKKAVKEFEVPMKRDSKTGEIDHPAQVMVIDNQGRIAYNFLNPSVDWLVTASERLSR